MRPEDDLEEWSEVESSSWELKIQLEDPVEDVNEITGFLANWAEAKAEAAWAAACAPSTWPPRPTWCRLPTAVAALVSPASLEVVEPDLLALLP